MCAPVQLSGSLLEASSPPSSTPLLSHPPLHRPLHSNFDLRLAAAPGHHQSIAHLPLTHPPTRSPIHSLTRWPRCSFPAKKTAAGNDAHGPFASCSSFESLCAGVGLAAAGRFVVSASTGRPSPFQAVGNVHQLTLSDIVLCSTRWSCPFYFDCWKSEILSLCQIERRVFMCCTNRSVRC